MNPLRIALLVSGSGRTLRNLLELERSGILPIKIALVISSRAGVAALQHAADFDVPAHVLKATEVTQALDKVEPSLVVMAGYLKRWDIPERYLGRTINIHPALLPLHGGPGFYGDRVHQAALDAGEAESGCTVHFVTLEYDKGPIIDQARVPVLPGDDAHTLADRVFEQELILLPRVIAGIARGDIPLQLG